jgi:Cu(I)/Ag(I) efflux system membrane protein CusA/SilA
MGVKVRGRNLNEIERVGYDIAAFLKEVPGVSAEAVIPDRVIGKPYLEIDIDRAKIARYGLAIRDVQDVIEIAIGGIPASTTVEGRERYPVRVRYERELRDSVEAMERILVPAGEGVQVPLAELATIEYVSGPEEIKSEDTFLVSYVLFDKRPEFAEVEVVEAARRYLDGKIASGELVLPPNTNYTFAGSYENQMHFQKRFAIILPVSLFLIFLVLYFQFRLPSVTFLVFITIAVGWAGGFIALWLAAQPWFLNFDVFGHSVRGILHLRQYNLSVAVWVGFIALFGVAVDDAVIITTYLNQLFASRRVASVAEIRALVMEGGRKRVRPCLMTTATTVLALLPILTSSGKGADVMIPMALPLIGGLTIELITLYITPVCYSGLKEFLWKRGWTKGHFVQ